VLRTAGETEPLGDAFERLFFLQAQVWSHQDGTGSRVRGAKTVVSSCAHREERTVQACQVRSSRGEL